MRIITRTLLGLSLPALLLATGSSYAAARLQNVDSTMLPSGQSALRLHFDSKVGLPQTFIMKQPAGIVLDFPDATTAMGKRSKALNARSVKKVRVASGAKKLRIMVSLNKLTKYTTSVKGNNIILTFDDKQVVRQKPRIVRKPTPVTRQPRVVQQRKVIPKRRVAVREVPDQNLVPGPVVRQKSVKYQAVASTYVPRRAAPQRRVVAKRVVTPRPRPVVRQAKYRPVAPRRAAYQPVVNRNVLGAIDFHRTQNGGGRAIIRLPSTATIVNSRKSGNSIILTVKNTNARQPRKRIDVTDFATPASYIDVARNGRDVQIKVIASSAFDFKVSRNANQYVIDIQKQKRKVAVNPLQLKKKVYRGKKLSLNFQDIEVRSVLQLLADFTNKNIVVSDSVKGNITLRMKDVPWDQALDIVLESKGLAMRSNGNVIWVAPAKELSAKEQSELQALQRKQALEPLITDYISVNYAKAEDLVKLVQSSANNKSEGSLLSKRGSVSVDKRTNTLLIQDTASHVNDVRALIKTLDVPVRQVSIESRIVYATDGFTKKLGARFGVTKFNGNSGISGGLGATNSMVNDLAGGSGTVGIPSVADRLNVNMPVVGAAGKLAFSLLSKDYLLDLELSALQAENKGEVISTPRVVTANKKKAVIEKGVEVPYETESASGGTTIAFKKAVLGLEVTPQITPDDHVIMDLLVRQDEINSYYQSSSGQIPIIDTRNVTTQVLVDNGQTVVLGGVHEEINTHDVTKVPLLGDLPVVGNLFKTKGNKKNKRELLIFVTPKIMR